MQDFSKIGKNRKVSTIRTSIPRVKINSGWQLCPDGSFIAGFAVFRNIGETLISGNMTMNSHDV